MVKTKEEKREYNKKYRENNLEKEKLRNKKYYEENKEKTKLSKKKYYQENKEKTHKRRTITAWKHRGLICDDYESLYYLVMSTEKCDGCNCILTGTKPRTSTTKMMDHDHETGEFRAVLCLVCNARQPQQKQIKL